MSCGSHFSCGIRVDGTLECFGEWPRVAASPGAPGKDTRFMEVSARELDICGITAEAQPRVLCWGASGVDLTPPPDLTPHA